MSTGLWMIEDSPALKVLIATAALNSINLISYRVAEYTILQPQLKPTLVNLAFSDSVTT